MDSCVGEGGGAGGLMHLVGPDFGPLLHFTASVDQKSEGSRSRGEGEGQNLGIFRSHLLPLPPCPQMNTSKKSPIGRGGRGRAALCHLQTVRVLLLLFQFGFLLFLFLL